jgi:hypothetical protein
MLPALPGTSCAGSPLVDFHRRLPARRSSTRLSRERLVIPSPHWKPRDLRFCLVLRNEAFFSTWESFPSRGFPHIDIRRIARYTHEGFTHPGREGVMIIRYTCRTCPFSEELATGQHLVCPKCSGSIRTELVPQKTRIDAAGPLRPTTTHDQPSAQTN